MSKGLPRQRILAQIRKAIKDTYSINYRLDQIVEIAAERSQPINRNIDFVVDNVNKTREVLETFRQLL